MLSVTDNVDNTRRSRRFVLFDSNTTDVTIQSEFPMRVLSASKETDYMWITQRSGRMVDIFLDWENHFTNELHRHRGFLKRIATYRNGIIDTGAFN